MQYRREIDGLRAGAVLPVILFHGGSDWFGGGFVGVDVFFVISGYLVTSIIASEMRSGTFTLVRFYERRARRILPALTFVVLEDRGHRVNRKRVQRLMRQMDLTALYPRRRTSQPGKGHKIYPYLLRHLSIERANQVWASDITFCPMAKGFMYLVAIIDWHSRRVLSWRVSNTLDTSFCVEALEEALQRFGTPEIFNTDQGSQFTSEAFTDVLKDKGVAISMDGKGRWVDNVFVERLWRSVKYEDLYLRAYETPAQLRAGLYFAACRSPLPGWPLINSWIFLKARFQSAYFPRIFCSGGRPDTSPLRQN